MKGIVLAGGNGRRLEPVTNVTNKHLLAVYDKPMVFYPIQTLIDAEIKDILIVSGKDHAGGFLKLLGSGKDFNVRFSYEVQDEAGGIAQALSLAQDFVDTDSCAVILGDNIFEDRFKDQIEDFNEKGGAQIFLKQVQDPQRFGVAELNGEQVVNIEEKPSTPKTDFAVTGLYLYDNNVFEIISTLKPSSRGELEITDVNNVYIKNGLMTASFVNGLWTDAGTFESLYRANSIARNIFKSKQADGRQG